MIEHISIPVQDFPRAKKFYAAALKPLNYTLHRDYPGAAGFMEGGHTSIWLIEKGKKVMPIHVALLARSKQAVQKFHAAALTAGARDHGAPGFRLDYGNDYYAAFVLDADGNNIEACYFGARAQKPKAKPKPAKRRS